MSARRLVALVGLAIALVFALVAASEAAPLFEAKKLTPSDAEAGDVFGTAWRSVSTPPSSGPFARMA